MKRTAIEAMGPSRQGPSPSGTGEITTSRQDEDRGISSAHNHDQKACRPQGEGFHDAALSPRCLGIRQALRDRPLGSQPEVFLYNDVVPRACEAHKKVP